jgi:histidinol-phosphatase (PHP family)
MLKWDGHTHTKYCKHGSPAGQEMYLDRAVQLGFERYTISEHPPLPYLWVNNEKLMAELAMSKEELPAYLDYAHSMKLKYAGVLDVTVGLEMDYLDGGEAFSDALLEPVLHRLEDVVVSVHYLPGAGGMRCIDYTPADFAEGLLSHYGHMDAVVNEYYDHVEKALEWAARLPIRKRLGHINLIEKFRTELPEPDPALVERRLRGILPKLKESGAGIDVNVAGLRVATCGRAYVPEWFIRECVRLGIPCVYGSDSHKPEQVGFAWEWFKQALIDASGQPED